MNSPFLDVAIGLAFIFLFLSLICTAFNEGLSSIIGLRATFLKKALNNLFSDDHVQAIMKHELIAKLSTNGNPSYIPAKTFAAAMVGVLAKGGTTNTEIKANIAGVLGELSVTPKGKYLQGLFNQAEGDIEKFKQILIEEFNDVMDRASGWYKRRIQIITLIFSCLLVVYLNVDTLGLTKFVYENSSARASLVALAQTTVNAGTPNDNQTVASRIAGLRDMASQIAVPLGDWSHLPQNLGGWLAILLGWFMTVLAISLGAPFWFDTLSKLIQVRGTGANPDEKKTAKS
jgi:hypothetical protein